MFRKVAADALGISDIGKVIKPEDYDKVEADDYVMHEEEEKIFFLIKSKADEYCFTNRALIHVDGATAVSKKKMLKRYEYYQHPMGAVFLETAGTVDLDIEIKFRMGETSYSIDVDKRQIEQLKDLYKALLKISLIQGDNNRMMQFATNSLSTAASSVTRSSNSSGAEEQFKAINEYSFDWMQKAYETHVRKDFGDVFQKFINN